MGPLSYRQTADAACRAIERMSRARSPPSCRSCSPRPPKSATRRRPASSTTFGIVCRIGGAGPDRGRFRSASTTRSDRLADPRETIRARARDRGLARCLRSRRCDGATGAGAGFRLFRHRQIFRGQRAAQGARSAARSFRLRQVRSVQARHPLCHAGASLSESGPPASGKSEAELQMA